MRKQETREEMYKKALELARSAYKQNTHCSLIMDVLHKGRIKAGRVNFLALEGFNTYLGRLERILIEEEGGFELSAIIYKSLENDKVNKKLIQEATLSKSSRAISSACANRPRRMSKSISNGAQICRKAAGERFRKSRLGHFPKLSAIHSAIGITPTLKATKWRSSKIGLISIIPVFSRRNCPRRIL